MMTAWIQGLDIPKDKLYGSVPQIPLAEALICQGLMYYISSVDSGTAERVFLLRVGANKVNLVANLESGVKTPVKVIEAPTISAVGTPIAARNYNRNYLDDNLLVKLFSGSSYTGGDTIRNNQAGFGSSPGHSASGQARSGGAYGLRRNTDYIISFTPAATTDTVLILDFFEVQ